MEREREREREGMKKSGRRILSLLCVHVRYFSRSPVRSSLSREKERERERGLRWNCTPARTARTWAGRFLSVASCAADYSTSPA
jgi:hypothetical protein